MGTVFYSTLGNRVRYSGKIFWGVSAYTELMDSRKATEARASEEIVVSMTLMERRKAIKAKVGFE